MCNTNVSPRLRPYVRNPPERKPRPVYQVNLQRQRPTRPADNRPRQERRGLLDALLGPSILGKIAALCLALFLSLVFLLFLGFCGVFVYTASVILPNF